MKNKSLKIVALSAPLLGVLVAQLFHFQHIEDFWRGLIVQLFLLMPILEMRYSKMSLSFVGLKRKGLVRSIIPSVLLIIGYLVLLIIAAHANVHLSHYDNARQTYGNLFVVCLYIPFWGIAEAIWINYLIVTIKNFLKRKSLDWLTIILASLYFGFIHCFVQYYLFDVSLLNAVSFIYIGLFAGLAGLLLKKTGNGWGFLLFWTIVNF